MIRCPICAETHRFDLAACPHCGFAPESIAGFGSWAPDLAAGGGGFKAEFFEELAKLEFENFWFRARNSLVVWGLRKYFPQFQSLLELGCGTGFVLSAIAEAFPSTRLVGTELFTQGLKVASQRVPAAEFFQMDGRHIPYEEEFDVIGTFDVLEHIREDELVLAGMHRALKPGGGILLTVPQHQWLWSSADAHACHERRYSASQLHAKVIAAGFEIIRSTSFVTVLLPAMAASRLRWKNAPPRDPFQEFRVPKWVNRSLESLLGLEQIAIRIGISLPMGGSRLLVARKNTNEGNLSS